MKCKERHATRIFELDTVAAESSAARFVATSPSLLSKRARCKCKPSPPKSDRGLRRSTHSLAAKEGFRNVALPDSRRVVKKRRKNQKPDEHMEKVQGGKVQPTKQRMKQKPVAEHTSDSTILATPIQVMQRIGTSLGIAAEDLTKEKLLADPKENADKKVSNDE
jgi:hypothetical protein